MSLFKAKVLYLLNRDFEGTGEKFKADQERLGNFLEGEHNLMRELSDRPSPEETAAIFLEHLLDRLTAEAIG